MTKKKLNESKEMLKIMRDSKASVEQMSEEDCFACFGISKAQVLKNTSAAISKYEHEIQKAENPQESRSRKIYEIAAKHLIAVEERGGLEMKYSDRENFIEVSVGGLEAALEEAYEAGRKAK